MTKILVTGVNGQFGGYFSDKAIENGSTVFGLIRRSSVDTLYRIKHLVDNNRFTLVEGDITDSYNVSKVVEENDFIVNGAAQSHVMSSFDSPLFTTQVNYLGVINILEAVRQHSKHTKVVQCSTSEMFGSNINKDGFQNESTPFSPNSSYGCSKLASHHLLRIYRDAFGIKACGAIMFNYESPKRGLHFITRKITNFIGRIVASDFQLKEKLQLGNLESKRDWSHCKDSVNAVWLLLHSDKVKDYVIGSGITHSIIELLETAFGYIKLDYKDWIEINPSFIRPLEVEELRADSSLIRQELGWCPTISFEDLIREMVDYDIKLALKALD